MPGKSRKPATKRIRPLTQDPRYPRVRCTGTTKAGARCKKDAVHGTLFCEFHGDQDRCAGENKDGSPCNNSPMDGQRVCNNHDPERVAARDARAARCTGHRADGSPCTAWPVTGLTVCRKHGGSAPSSRRVRARYAEEEKARKALARLGEPVPVDNALLAIQRRAGRIEAFADFVEQRLFEVDVKDWRYSSTQELEQIHGLVQLHMQAQAQSVTSLATLSRVQVDERLAAIEQQKADMIMSAFEAALAAAFTVLGVSNPEAAKAAYGAFSRKLTVIPAAVEAA